MTFTFEDRRSLQTVVKLSKIPRYLGEEKKLLGKFINFTPITLFY